MSNEFSVKATIDLHEMDHDDIVELLGKCFDELSFAEKEDFMRLNLDEANNDDIEQYYLDNRSSSTEEDDDSLEPCSLENDQRSRLRPAITEAIDIVKQMYNFMGWK